MPLPAKEIPDSRKIFYIDLLRAVACLCVVMLHVSAVYVFKGVENRDFWVGNLFDSASRAGVPLFVMISGALMLDENYVFAKEKWFRHILKLLCFFLFWSVAYAVIYPFIKHEEINLLNAVRSILKGHYHLWFIPMIIGLYLMIPLLRLWVNRQNKQYVEYFLLLSFVFSFVIPQAIQLLVCFRSGFSFLYDVIDRFYLKYTSGFTSYFILGWYLRNYELTHKKLCYCLGMAGLCITFLGTYGELSYLHSNEWIFYSNFSVNVCLYSIAVFVLIKSLYGSVRYSDSFFHLATRLVNRNSLGIYAVHAAILAEVSPLFSQLHALIAVPLIFVITMIASLILSMLLQKIPLIRKVI